MSENNTTDSQTEKKETKLDQVPKRDKTTKEIQIMDPIHGFINISEYPVIEQLVDSQYFQRLRRLSQLGLVSAVYPNATHTRFAHCLGVMHVFLILFDSIVRRTNILKQERIENLRPLGAVTALLHDLGHGPFSHASESILNNGDFNHLDMTCKIIRANEIQTILKNNNIDADIVCDILKHQGIGDIKLLSQLVSSQLDADRLDYLVRDSFFTGVHYGHTDVHRIANMLEICNDGQFKGTAIVVNAKGISAIEDYILGRFLMYKRVYYHKISRCMELLTVNAFKRAHEKDKKTGLNKIMDISFDPTPKMLYELDDALCYSLFQKWKNIDDQTLQDLATRIMERRRLKSTQEFSLEEYYDLNHKGKIDKIKQIFDNTKYDIKYHLIEDSPDTSAYDPYNPGKIDDNGFDPTSHIVIPLKDGNLKEISTVSPVIEILSKEKIKKVRFYFPEEFSPRVEAIVNG